MGKQFPSLPNAMNFKSVKFFVMCFSFENMRLQIQNFKMPVSIK